LYLLGFYSQRQDLHTSRKDKEQAVIHPSDNQN
jgi:hypothetical protein